MGKLEKIDTSGWIPQGNLLVHPSGNGLYMDRRTGQVGNFNMEEAQMLQPNMESMLTAFEEMLAAGELNRLPSRSQPTPSPSYEYEFQVTPDILPIGYWGNGRPASLHLYNDLASGREHFPTGPILAKSGNHDTNLHVLHNIAAGVTNYHHPKDLALIILSRDPSLWAQFEFKPHCQQNLFNLSGREADHAILGVAGWAYEARSPKKSVILLIDDLKCALDKFEVDTYQNLLWLIAKGCPRRVLTVAAADPSNSQDIAHTISGFPSVIEDQGKSLILTCQGEKSPPFLLF